VNYTGLHFATAAP